MKYYPNNIENIISKISKGEILSLLLYGPDSGMISDLIKKISKKLERDINYIDDGSYSNLFSALNNQNFFAKKEIVKINVKASKLDKNIEELILSVNIHFPILIADQLATSSALRKLFETTNNLGVIACYPDDEKSIRQIIVTKMTENHKQLTSESLEYLISKIGGDRLIVINELEKLLCYLGDRPKITLQDCQKVISESVESHPDLLCIYFAQKNASNYLRELNSLIENSVSVVWILRALARFYLNLLTVKLQEADGASLGDAVASIKPPIFFKILPDFREVASKTSIKDVSDIINHLTIAEIEAKNGRGENEILDNLFIKHFL